MIIINVVKHCMVGYVLKPVMDIGKFLYLFGFIRSTQDQKTYLTWAKAYEKCLINKLQWFDKVPNNWLLVKNLSKKRPLAKKFATCRVGQFKGKKCLSELKSDRKLSTGKWLCNTLVKPLNYMPQLQTVFGKSIFYYSKKILCVWYLVFVFR